MVHFTLLLPILSVLEREQRQSLRHQEWPRSRGMEICKVLLAALVFVFLAVCSTAQHASNGGPRPLVGGPRHVVGGQRHGEPRGNYRPLQAHEAAEVEDVFAEHLLPRNTLYTDTVQCKNTGRLTGW